VVLRRQIIKAAGLCAFAGTAGSPAKAAPEPTAPVPYEWKTVPFGGGGFIDGFVFHPAERGLLYARTDIGGAYRFDPASRSWVPLLDSLSKADSELMGVMSLAVDPVDRDRLYLACGLYHGEWNRKGALLASTDRGATWQINDLNVKIGGNEPGRGSGERLQVDPNRGDVLLLGTMQDGLLKSSNRGTSFARLGFPAKHVSLVLFDPRSGTPGTPTATVYAGGQDQPGLYVSHDGGLNFAREPGTPEQVPQHACFGPDGTLYVTFSLGDSPTAGNPGSAKTGGVWKRDKTGRWADITPVKPGPGNLAFGYSGLDADRRTPGRLVVSTIERWSQGDDVFLSTDDGAHWTPLGSRSRHDATPYPWFLAATNGQDRMGHWISDVKIDPFDGERAIYGTGYGLWLTANLGAAQKPGSTVNWAFAVANLEETATLELRSPDGVATLLGAMGDVSGAAWDDQGKTPKAGLFTPTWENNRSIDFAQLKPALMARTTDAPAGGYWSPDAGETWRAFASFPRPRQDKAGSIAVSAKGSFFVWVSEQGQAHCSLDHGKTWKQSEGWPQAGRRGLKAVADRALDGVFYVHELEGGRIFVSVDGGQSFKASITGLPAVAHWQASQLLSAPGQMGDLWLALPDVLVHLPGPGKPVKTIRPVVEPWMIALGKSAPQGPYHSVYVWGKVTLGKRVVEGLFRSDDAGETFTRINDDAHRYGRLLSMAADPVEHGTVYLAPHGRGVIVGRPRRP
jgi:hypothetical protein